jgi:CelD/BcsL family acetyltransferase involved in cellulose biosynthesis
VYSPTVRAVGVMREGWLGRADAYTAEVIMDELMAALDRREGDVLLFRQLEHDSVLHRAALARSTFATRRQHAARTNVHWIAELKPTLDEYLATVSPSTRKSVRRTAGRLEREYGDRLSIATFDRSDELERFLADVESVAARTYQRRIGVGYVGDESQQQRLLLLAQRGWFRGYVLYLDDRPVAFELGELYRGRFHSLAGAYDPEYAHDRVGAYLLMKVFEDLGADVDASVFDFGFGDAAYKAKLSQRRFEEGDFVVYARRPRPIWIKFARTAMLELTSATTRALRRLSLLERIKQRRRRTEAAVVS